ncbi:MAG TPA: hypothetical protein VF634_08825 [Pyrinomonadaceae bacterium]
MELNRGVDLGHEADGFGKSGEGLPVVREVVVSERAPLAILERWTARRIFDARALSVNPRSHKMSLKLT